MAQKLRGDGYAVTVVNLPAHGTDPLPAAYATLDAYVQAVSAAVHNGDSLPVHLVGHSLGGMVISQFAESDPSSVQDLVYVAGMLPMDGQTSVALFDTSSYVIQHMYVNYTDLTVGVTPDVIGPGFCADCNAKQLSFLQSNFREEPLLPLLAPVSLTAANFGSVTKKYVFTTDDQTITYPFQQAMAATATLARTATITSSHQAQTSHAGQLKDILLDLTR